MDSLLKIIEGLALPWASDFERPCLIPTGAAFRKNHLPPGVRATRKLPCGPRVPTRWEHPRANPDVSTATWPQDDLVEVAGAPIVIFVFDGRVDFWAGDHVIHCDHGYFLLLPPGTRQQGAKNPHYEIDPNTENFSDLLWIQRVGRVIRIWTCHCRDDVHGSKIGMQADFLNDAANSVFDLMIAEAENGQEQWETLCRHYLCTLLTYLQRELRLGTILISSRRIQVEWKMDPGGDPIEQARNYIRTHMKEKVTIDKVARYLYMSRTQFVQKFRQETGKTFVEYLTQCRIEESKTLLCGSSWSVQKISRTVGIRSTSYFCKLFAEHEGMSPQTYRNNETSNSSATPR